MGTPPPLCCGYVLSAERSQQETDSDPKQTCRIETNELWLYVCFLISWHLDSALFSTREGQIPILTIWCVCYCASVYFIPFLPLTS
jgi:hypothetical protein